MLFYPNIRFFMIFVLLLPCCWPYTFQLYEPRFPNSNHYCVGSFIDYQVGSPFCIRTTPIQKNNFNRLQQVPANPPSVPPKVDVYPAFEGKDPSRFNYNCETKMIKSSSSSGFDTVVCDVKNYPVLWVGIAFNFKFNEQHYNALVLRNEINIDETIVSEFFVGETGMLNARVVASKSDYNYLVRTEMDSETLPKRGNVKVEYVKFATGTVVQPDKKNDYEFDHLGLIAAQEDQEGAENHEENPSLKTTVAVNVAQFSANFKVIGASLNFKEARYVLRVYFAESFEEILKLKTVKASENRITIKLKEERFVSKVSEFLKQDKSLQECKIYIENGCVTELPGADELIKAASLSNVANKTPVYFYCIKTPSSSKKFRIDSLAEEFQNGFKQSSYSIFNFNDKQNSLAFAVNIYSSDELHTILNQVANQERQEVKSALCICSSTSMFYTLTAEKTNHSQTTKLSIKTITESRRRRLVV